jgi:hypothetical protein
VEFDEEKAVQTIPQPNEIHLAEQMWLLQHMPTCFSIQNRRLDFIAG